MGWARSLGVGCAAVLVGVAPAAASARIAPISGKLSRPGYTVIAVAANGKATLVRAGRGSFALRPPAAVVSLQLRAANGVYAGPVVVGVEQRGKRVIMGVRAGAKLGRIDVYVGKGYAKVRRKLPTRWLDVARWARATRGVPIGNGRNDGFVRSKPPPARVRPPGDLDADGVPDVIDVDDNGNLVLDAFDRSGTARASQAQASIPMVFSTSVLELDLSHTVNANAPNLTDQQIEAALPEFGGLIFGIGPLAADPGTQVELDCGDPNTGLVYCRQNGSIGTVGGFGPPIPPGVSPGAPYPACCDPDGNGFGALAHSNVAGSVIYDIPLLHHASTAEVHTGQVFIIYATFGGVASQFPGAIQYVFQTAPAVTSYSDGQGNAATISYPVAAGDPAMGVPGGPGTRSNPFQVAAGPDGNVLLTLTFWRPQRRPFEGEAGSWIDIGHILYHATIADFGIPCPQQDFSTTDPNLTPASPAPFGDFGALLDSTNDQPADSAHPRTLSFTLNLTQCLAFRGVSFNPGDERGVRLGGLPGNPTSAGSGDAATLVWFKRQ
jgi:hypothetical protein